MIELVYFATVCVVFLIAYGVAVLALLYPNTRDDWSHILHKIFFYPYFGLFADFGDHLEELKGAQLYTLWWFVL